MKLKFFALSICLISFATANKAYSFCGFFVAKADTKIFNKASKVVMVRDQDRTVLTMANDFKGDPKDFAIVIPVPVVLKKKQINVSNQKAINHLDQYTAPRLVEYFDSNPCSPMRYRMGSAPSGSALGNAAANKGKAQPDMGVTVEARYEIGEYDIMILSAKESGGLLKWLNSNGYKTPKQAKRVLRSYIKRGLKFFVAKVNLKRQSKSEFSFLRPIQVAYKSKRFDLPIRLGMVNANGPQDLFVFALTKRGRVEVDNYQTARLPTGKDIPIHVKGEFSKFYTSMFDTLVKKHDMKKVYLEYAWDMAWCDPCAADPLSNDELRDLGVWWVKPNEKQSSQQLRPVKRNRAPRPQDVFVTRMHVRYTSKTFPDDLRFNVTSDRRNFQGRFVLRHEYKGVESCDAMTEYKKNLVKRKEQEAKNLASLTGWDINEIRKKMNFEKPQTHEKRDWIDDVWR